MKYLLIILTLFCLTACQHISSPNKETEIIQIITPTNYGQYYLGLKKLSNEQLLTEIHQQKRLNSEEFDSNIKLLMIHSLPNSSIHNPYTAKTILNKYQFDNSQYFEMNNSDIALLTVLRDQLNQQILLFQKLIGQDLVNDRNIAQLAQQTNTINQLNVQLSSLNEQLSLLKLQLQQLKTIELNINNHGTDPQ